MNRTQFRATIAAGLLSASFALAYADDLTAADTQRFIVRYTNAELLSDDGALAVYRRIATAATRVCPAADPRDLGMAVIVRTCREDAIARAVQRIGNERLAAIHAARGGRPRVA